jgi:cysteine-rich repeat protein
MPARIPDHVDSRSMRTRLLPLLLVLPLALPSGCDGPDAPSDPVARCGDGAIDADEACDDGADNDDTIADACRTDCRLPRCGDGVVDGGEACDDGGVLGGDGCDATCGVEAGALEVEPNDAPEEATPIEIDGYGSLAEEDVDCWSFSAPRCGAVRVTERAPCGSALTMALYGPDGARPCPATRSESPSRTPRCSTLRPARISTGTARRTPATSIATGTP